MSRKDPANLAPAFSRLSIPAVFALTLFGSSVLLFLVQPMVGKMVLPWYGGAAAVWTACLLFFQALLLAGYAYAHAATTWLGVRRQAVLHLVLLMVPIAFFPIVIIPDRVPADAANPLPSLLLMLTVTVGVPFFVVSSSGPLLQKWFAATAHPAGRDPYFLYGASNLGSLLALVAYPTLVEPNLSLVAQGFAWAVAYGLLAVLFGGCAFVVWRSAPVARGAGDPPSDPVANGRRVRWVLLAFAPSSLMLGATTYLTTDVTSQPLLWLPPLILYLLSFILVFSRRPTWLPDLKQGWVFALPILVLVLLFLMLSGTHPPVGWSVVLHLAVLFVACMVCHGELARDRPPATHLTEFYLWISIGGVLGGVFNALVAPLIFDAVVEYPLALVLACLLLPPLAGGKTGARGAGVEIGVAGLCALIGLALLAVRSAAGLDFTHFAAGRWAWAAVVPAGFAVAGVVHVLKGKENRLYRLLDFLAPAALCLLVAGLILEVNAEVFLIPLTRLAGAVDQPPLVFQKILVFGAPAVICFTFVDRSLRFGLGVGALLFAAGFCGLFNPTVLFQTRTFYGVLQVTTERQGGRDYYCLYNGTTLHGQEALDGADRAEPRAYYHRDGPIGQVFAAYNREDEPVRNVAVIGLGAGALAAYGRPGQHMTFHEIDPAVRDVARDGRYFTFWSEAEKRGVVLDLVMGDARLTLKQRPFAEEDKYGLLVVDAFSSDAVPTHLIDREALALYLSRLAERGIVAFHISNRHLDLEPVLANLAHDANLAALRREAKGDDSIGKAASTWVVLARKKEDLDRLPRGTAEAEWREPTPDPGVGVWTDDYSNVWGVLHLQW